MKRENDWFIGSLVHWKLTYARLLNMSLGNSLYYVEEIYMTMEKRVYVLLRRYAAVALFGTWCLVSAVLSAEADNHSTAEWAQWRGPNRDGISSETGFLKNWSQEGPKVLWHIPFGDWLLWYLHRSR